MRYLLERDLTIGMLENSGAERRHQIGKIQFKKTLYGGGKLLKGMTPCENRSAYLTLRGLLIWQYGRDILATENAIRKLEPKNKGENRGRDDDGWSPIRYSTDQYCTNLPLKMRKKRKLSGKFGNLGIKATVSSTWILC